jgi:hypothetical protein
MPSYWCYRCEDFTTHQPLTNNNAFCAVCGRERESALTRPMPNMAEKVPEFESTRYVIRGYYRERWYYLNHQNRWTEFQSDAKQFQEKREALEAFETTPRPWDDFYPGLLTIDDRDKDFTFSDDGIADKEEDDFLTDVEDFEAWEPPDPGRTNAPIVVPRLWGERQIPGLAQFHEAIAELSNPDGTFREEGSEDDV